MARLRDPKTGRFTKRPPPTPIDPELVKGLCPGPRLVHHEWQATQWHLEITERTDIYRDPPGEKM